MALVNAILVRWNGGLHWVEDLDAIAERGYRVEGYLELGGAGSIAEVERTAQAVLADKATPAEGIVLGLEPDTTSTPYADFEVGDYLAIDHNGVEEDTVRVLGLTVAEDEMGDPIYVPELGTLKEQQTDRLQRWLKRMSNGALGGSIESAAPVPKQDRPKVELVGLTTTILKELPPFSLAGSLIPSTSGRYYPSAEVVLITMVASLRVAGTSTTSYRVLKNGSSVATGSLASGAQLTTTSMSVSVAPSDYVQVEITGAGTGAKDLTVQLRYA